VGVKAVSGHYRDNASFKSHGSSKGKGKSKLGRFVNRPCTSSFAREVKEGYYYAAMLTKR